MTKRFQRISHHHKYGPKGLTMSDYISKLRNHISDLSTESSHSLIIVEGKKDILCLSDLGISNVREIKGPIFQFCEELAEELSDKDRKAIILTDFDTEGKKLYSSISKNLTRLGVDIDNKFRELLMHTPVVHIEGLNTFLKNHQDNS